ncbi:MAG: LON peptidase substrate-binding domain-containing protein [Burkholderiales bacterium]|nr:LON peptidase substrate-binding domain-containing protein [Burkholderiales bacterium]
MAKLFGKRDTVAIFPLGTVLFPGGILPLKIFEVRYVDMAKDCLKQGAPFGVCLIREGAEVGAPAVPEPVGCLARIKDCDVEELGVLKVTAEGLERFRIVSTDVSRQGLVVGRVENLHPEAEVTDAPGLAQSAQFLRKVIAGIGPQRFAEPHRFEDASWVGFRLAEILPLRMDVKQKLLELTDATLRLAILHKFLQQQKLL